LDSWFRKFGEKNAEFDLHREKETFMEARESFMGPGASRSQNQMSIVSRKDKPKDTIATQDSDPMMLKSFPQTCMKLLWNQKVVEGQQALIDNCANEDNPLPKQCAVNKVKRSKKRTDREMWLTASTNDFEMDLVILYLGFDANILSNKTCEHMGKPKLQWSPIQLCMENQQKIIPMGCLHGVTLDIEGARAVVELEVIEIVDDSNPYPTLLEINWDFDMNAIINLKKQITILESVMLNVAIMP